MGAPGTIGSHKPFVAHPPSDQVIYVMTYVFSAPDNFDYHQ